MRVKNIINKKECLECLFTEINILTECRHPNVVKILDASFDGTVVKEQLMKQGECKKEEASQIAEQQEKNPVGAMALIGRTRGTWTTLLLSYRVKRLWTSSHLTR